MTDDVCVTTHGTPPPQLFYPFQWGAFDGDVPTVNGKAFPFMEVKARAYRFRVLNGCNSRFLRMSLPDGPTIWQVSVHPSLSRSLVQQLIPACVIALHEHQIGSDGGFLNEPVRVKQLIMGPSERADIIIDFYGYEGETLFLRNTAPVPFVGTDGNAPSRTFPQPINPFLVCVTAAAPHLALRVIVCVFHQPAMRLRASGRLCSSGCSRTEVRQRCGWSGMLKCVH
jgi:FtsP/CotA-like multicopper oxidase with cupredoxin domain